MTDGLPDEEQLNRKNDIGDHKRDVHNSTIFGVKTIFGQPECFVLLFRHASHLVVLFTLHRPLIRDLHPSANQLIIVLGVYMIENHMQKEEPRAGDNTDIGRKISRTVIQIA